MSFVERKLALEQLEARRRDLEKAAASPPDSQREIDRLAEVILVNADIMRHEQRSGDRLLGIVRTSASRRREREARKAAHDATMLRTRLEAEQRVKNAALASLRRSLDEEIHYLVRILTRDVADVERIDREKRAAAQAEAREQRERERSRRDQYEKDLAAARLAAADKQSRDLAAKIRQQILKSDRCPYCTGVLSDPECDHIVPLKRGGLSAAVNMVYVCRPCNQRKASFTLRQFCRQQGLDYMAVVRRLEELGKEV